MSEDTNVEATVTEAAATPATSEAQGPDLNSTGLTGTKEHH